jgi:hypothetical protein
MRSTPREAKPAALFGSGAALVLVFGAGAAGLVASAGYVDSHPPRTLPAAVLFLLAGGLVLGGVASPFLMVSMRRAHERRERQSEEEFASIDDAAAKIEDKALGRLVSFNFRLMDRFVNVALGQAKSAYLFCAISACAALLVLLAGTTALLTAETATAQISVGVLTAAGAALSGFISVTFMRTFALTSKQMSYYYGQPLVHCYLLHAEWLAERSGQRSELSSPFDEQLVTATLAAGRDAQHHLLELLEVRRPAGDDATDEPATPTSPFKRRQIG